MTHDIRREDERPEDDDHCTCAERPQLEHVCPYDADVYEDFETVCTCCAYCEQECANGI